jgi:hypothetical protein
MSYFDVILDHIFNILRLYFYNLQHYSKSNNANETFNLTFTMSLYSCRIGPMCLSLTVNPQNLQQLLAKLSEIDQLLFTKIYVCQIYNRSGLFIVIRFTIFVFILQHIHDICTRIHRDFSSLY